MLSSVENDLAKANRRWMAKNALPTRDLHVADVIWKGRRWFEGRRRACRGACGVYLHTVVWCTLNTGVVHLKHWWWVHLKSHRQKTTKKSIPKRQKVYQTTARKKAKSKSKTNEKNQKEYECTCPVCGQTHKYQKTVPFGRQHFELKCRLQVTLSDLVRNLQTRS